MLNLKTFNNKEEAHHDSRTTYNHQYYKSKDIDVKTMLDFLAKAVAKKKLCTRKFSYAEADFLIRYFLSNDPEEILIFSLADYLSENYFLGSTLANAPAVRRINFFKHLIIGCNAKEAAIAAGYSPRSAKQQGYRVLRWIQEHQNAIA